MENQILCIDDGTWLKVADVKQELMAQGEQLRAMNRAEKQAMLDALMDADDGEQGAPID